MVELWRHDMLAFQMKVSNKGLLSVTNEGLKVLLFLEWEVFTSF